MLMLVMGLCFGALIFAGTMWILSHFDEWEEEAHMRYRRTAP